MDINSVKENITKIQNKINETNLMLQDLDRCESPISKKVIEAAILKYGVAFEDKNVTE